MLQHIECSGRVGCLWSCWIPAHVKKLSCRVLGKLTVAVIQPNAMNTIGVNDDEIITGSILQVRAWFTDTMAQLDAKPNSFQGGVLKKDAIPLLKSSD